MAKRLYGDTASDFAANDTDNVLAPAPGATYQIYLPPTVANTDPSVRVTTGLFDLANSPIDVVTAAAADSGEKAHLKFYGTDLPSDLYYKVGTKFFVTHSTDIGARLDDAETGLATEVTDRTAAVATEVTDRTAAVATVTAAVATEVTDRTAAVADATEAAIDFTNDSITALVQADNPFVQYARITDGDGTPTNGRIIVVTGSAPFPPVEAGSILVYGSS